MIVVADASPLIALARIGRLELLRTMFERLLLPEAVWREVVAAGLDKAGAGTVMQADWIERRKVADAGMVELLRRDLGAGESEAIVLAREAGADLVLIDERAGRTAAKRLGLRVTGRSACSSKRESVVCCRTRPPWWTICIEGRDSGSRTSCGRWLL
jgi:uncharacterized protein